MIRDQLVVGILDARQQGRQLVVTNQAEVGGQLQRFIALQIFAGLELASFEHYLMQYPP